MILGRRAPLSREGASLRGRSKSALLRAQSRETRERTMLDGGVWERATECELRAVFETWFESSYVATQYVDVGAVWVCESS